LQLFVSLATIKIAVENNRHAYGKCVYESPKLIIIYNNFNSLLCFRAGNESPILPVYGIVFTYYNLVLYQLVIANIVHDFNNECRRLT